MKLDSLNTPVYVKTEKDMPWPEDKYFYLLSSEGLSICRNHEFFQSCAPAKSGPGELPSQKPFIKLSYPKIPMVLMEKAVGFFHHIYKAHHWESALILVWNRLSKQVELVCPEQKASWGAVKYDIPALPPHLLVIGDIHSHCDFESGASSMDKDDEAKRAGIHMIAGHLKDEPPDFSCDVVVDGMRFNVKNPESMMEDYRARNEKFPQEWIAKVKEKKLSYMTDGTCGYTGGSNGYSSNAEPNKEDQAIIERILARFKKKGVVPLASTVKSDLFAGTKRAGYLWCEKKAKEFVDNWLLGKDEKDDETKAA